MSMRVTLDDEEDEQTVHIAGMEIVVHGLTKPIGDSPCSACGSTICWEADQGAWACLNPFCERIQRP